MAGVQLACTQAASMRTAGARNARLSRVNAPVQMSKFTMTSNGGGKHVPGSEGNNSSEAVSAASSIGAVAAFSSALFIGAASASAAPSAEMAEVAVDQRLLIFPALFVPVIGWGALPRSLPCSRACFISRA